MFRRRFCGCPAPVLWYCKQNNGKCAGNGILDLLGDRGQAVGHVLVKLRGLGVLLNLTLEGGGDVLEQISHGLPHVLEGDGHLGLNVLDGTLLGSIWPGEDHLGEEEDREGAEDDEADGRHGAAGLLVALLVLSAREEVLITGLDTCS